MKGVVGTNEVIKKNNERKEWRRREEGQDEKIKKEEGLLGSGEEKDGERKGESWKKNAKAVEEGKNKAREGDMKKEGRADQERSGRKREEKVEKGEREKQSP